MPIYEVTLHYSGSKTIKVSAPDSESAYNQAVEESGIDEDTIEDLDIEEKVDS